MYCKFCGSRIAPNSTKCVSCGAEIDFTDGGQSFFDDNELNAWKSTEELSPAACCVPKTEMIAAVDYETELTKKKNSRLSSVSNRQRKQGNPHSHKHSRKKKSMIDNLNISSSNKLIILCIASVLIIVLLVVAIIAVISNNKNDDNSVSEDKAVADVVQPEEKGSNAETETVKTGDEIVNSKPEKNEEHKGAVPLENVILKKGDEVTVEAALVYIVDNVEYIALFDILKNEGYKDKIVNKKGNYVFDFKENEERRIEVAVDSKEIWFKNENDKKAPEPQYLKYKTMEIDGKIYVPAKDFLNKYGYKTYKFDKNENSISYGE